MFKPFAITGIGAVSAFGEGYKAYKENYNGKTEGIKPITLFAEDAYEHKVAGEILNFNPKGTLGLDRIRMYDRLTLILMEAMDDLLLQSEFKDKNGQLLIYPGENIAAAIGTLGPTKAISDLDFQVLEDPQFLQPSQFPNCVTCAALGYASIRNLIKACNYTLTNGETSSLDTFMTASILLNNGEAEMVITGGAEELSLQQALIIQNKFKHMKIENPVLGEGSVVFSCEKMENAVSRKANVIAEFIAYSTCFCEKVHEAIDFNLGQIQKQIPDEVFKSIEHIFWSEKNFEENKNYIEKKFHRPITNHCINGRVGYTYSALGAFQIGSAIASDKIPAGSVVLIMNVAPDGNCSCGIIRKAGTRS
jgi:3-oxoacyl-[acyl-carrier-protein] synthase II